MDLLEKDPLAALRERWPCSYSPCRRGEPGRQTPFSRWPAFRRRGTDICHARGAPLLADTVGIDKEQGEGVSLDIRLETESGRELARVEDAKGLLLQSIETCRSDLSLVRFVDPYGDTVFNHLQATVLLSDLKTLEDCTDDSETLTLLRELNDLAVRVANGIHLYLKVYGD